MPTAAQAANCTTIVDNTGSGGTTKDCTDLITIAKNGSVSFDFPATIDGGFVIELESRGEQIAALKVQP